jgi:hypothetical protein
MSILASPLLPSSDLCQGDFLQCLSAALWTYWRIFTINPLVMILLFPKSWNSWMASPTITSLESTPSCTNCSLPFAIHSIHATLRSRQGHPSPCCTMKSPQNKVFCGNLTTVSISWHSYPICDTQSTSHPSLWRVKGSHHASTCPTKSAIVTQTMIKSTSLASLAKFYPSSSTS